MTSLQGCLDQTSCPGPCQRWSNMTGLQELNLYQNQLSGTPHGVEQHDRSSGAGLAPNRLSGTLPSTWSHWSSLKSSLNNNAFGCRARPARQQPHLQVLDLRHNSFHGTLHPDLFCTHRSKWFYFPTTASAVLCRQTLADFVRSWLIEISSWAHCPRAPPT